MIKFSEILSAVSWTNVYNVIYKITNLINGKVYIGQTSISLRKRLLKHIYDANTDIKRRKHYLHRALSKHGFENFTVEVLETCDKEELDAREIYWISHFNSTDPQLGYNCTKGGQGNRAINVSEETRKLISDKNKTKWNDPTYRERQKQSRKESYARKCKPIVQLDLSYRPIKTWDSKTEVANQFSSNIFQLKGNRKVMEIGMYLFMHVDDYNNLNLGNPVVVQLDNEYNIINVFYSYRHANTMVKTYGYRSARLQFDVNQSKTMKYGSKKAGFIWMSYENYLKYIKK